MSTLILYTTAGCHLCEDAQALLGPVLTYIEQESGQSIALREQEISESAALVDVYGLRIPVIQLEGSTQDLGWPFDQAQAYQFIVDALGN
tara:strand:- start:676 stop:945 length:270 start_codon:yes stop_codon:yes gene_type:complete